LLYLLSTRSFDAAVWPLIVFLKTGERIILGSGFLHEGNNFSCHVWCWLIIICTADEQTERELCLLCCMLYQLEKWSPLMDEVLF